LSCRSTPPASSAPTGVAATSRRPGWAARARAKAGIRHPSGRVGVGYRSAVSAVHLSEREQAHHGALFGGPGSGKTMFLQLMVEACAGRMPVVVVDPKGSPALAATVRAHAGLVWTLDGRLPADLLDPRPWQVPDMLLEAEEYSPDARAYRDAAHQRALWAAWALALQGAPMDLASQRTLLDRHALMAALEPFRDRDPRIAEWLARLGHQHGGIEDSGLDRSLGVLLDGVAMRGSLRACPDAVRLDDVVETNGLVLFSLDAAEYPHATRKVASWILLGMGRLARQLGNSDVRSVSPEALLLVDEVGALGSAARHLRGLVGRARESGLAVVLATQGPSDLEAVDRALLPQVLQDTAWQLVFRQGSPVDARHMEALFGQAWADDFTRWSDGRSSSRQIQRPRVSADEWMNGLRPGDAWLRVAPVDRGWRQHRIRVASATRMRRCCCSTTSTPSWSASGYAIPASAGRWIPTRTSRDPCARALRRASTDWSQAMERLAAVRWRSGIDPLTAASELPPRSAIPTCGSPTFHLVSGRQAPPGPCDQVSRAALLERALLW
jgi:hypothetical protein